MNNSKKIRISHDDPDTQTGGNGSWWSTTLGVLKDQLVNWFSLKNNEIDSAENVEVNNAQSNAASFLAQLKQQNEESERKTLYLIGGSILAIVLIIVVAGMFKK